MYKVEFSAKNSFAGRNSYAVKQILHFITQVLEAMFIEYNINYICSILKFHIDNMNCNLLKYHFEISSIK